MNPIAPKITRRHLVGSAVAGTMAMPSRASAQPGVIRIGVLTDQSGLFRDITGPGSTACVRQAVKELGPLGFEVEVLQADHQNKPDIGSSIVRQWFDRDGVDLIVDCPTSSVALAVSSVARDRDKAFVCSGGGTVDLTGPACNANTLHWTYDTWQLAHTTGAAMVAAGGNTWFFVTADYSFGQALERDTSEFVRRAGGRVLGGVRTPFPATTDFSSFLVQAQASGAKVIGLANAGGDTVNCIKQASEFGIAAGGTRLAALLVYINDIHALGLDVARGLVLSETFYWDLNDRTRAFTARLKPSMPAGQVPSMAQAGCYSAVLITSRR